MSVDREKILERIRQLRQMTAARGCTEAEVLAAAAKAAELMAKIGVAEEDVEIEADASTLKGRRHQALNKLWALVAHCTNTAALNNPHTGACTFFGTAPGPQIAVYLRDVLDRAVAKELTAFKAGEFYRRRRSVKTKKQAVADFLEGLILRLGARLLKLFDATMSETAQTRAITYRETRHRTTSAGIKDHQVRYWEAQFLGDVAGRRPQLAHGVGGANGGPAALIGRASSDA